MLPEREARSAARSLRLRVLRPPAGRALALVPAVRSLRIGPTSRLLVLDRCGMLHRIEQWVAIEKLGAHHLDRVHTKGEHRRRRLEALEKTQRTVRRRRVHILGS